MSTAFLEQPDTITVWVAQCLVQDADLTWPRQLRQRVAVRADSSQAAQELVTLYYKAAPFALTKIEHCLPCNDYLEKYGPDAEVEDLRTNLHSGNRLEFGAPVVLNDTAPRETTFADILMRYGAPRVAPLFAVVDGAQFDDLPAALFDGAFVARPLYKPQPSRPAAHIITAPHLVALRERDEKRDGRTFEATLQALLSVLDNKPAAVFWQCSEGFETLYQHLRTVGRIMIPSADVPGPEAQTRMDEGQSHSMVAFRHADANVMSQTIRAMTEREASRLFGPAQTILFEPDAEWSDGRPWFQITREAHWPDPMPGTLTLGVRTMARMRALREDRFLSRINAYLFQVIPEKVAPLSPKEREVAIRTFVAQAQGFGMTTEAAFGRWCYMQFMLGGRLHEVPEVQQCFSFRDVPADEAMSVFMRQTIEVAQHHGL